MKQRLRVAIIVVLSGIGHATFAQSTQPDSSNLSAKDTRARALVVKIEAKWTPDRSRQTGASAEVGAGFIIAVSRDAEVTLGDAVAAPRFTVYSARYRLALKGLDRGKWEMSVTEEADAPLRTVDAVVRGVSRRSGDAAETVRLSGDEFRAATLVATRA